MNKTTVFIDGREGTTGLRIAERLAERSDIELLRLPEALRKDPAARKEMLNHAEISFLCLPDAAAVEAVSMVENPTARIIDASTAHRTLPGWAYGFPELSPTHLQAVCSSKRVAVPGCHASGFIALVHPLIKAGMLSADSRLICHSITGYSGGGKKMIAAYADEQRADDMASPRTYALGQTHKHLKEMQTIPGLAAAPIFTPIVSGFYSGMCVAVNLFAADLQAGATAEDIKQLYRSLYTGPMVRYMEAPATDSDGMLNAHALSGCDDMQIMVAGNDDRIMLLARYDNLGKGASGAAIECFNLMTGHEPQYGLTLSC